MVILSVPLVIVTTVVFHFLCISNLCDYFTVVILSLSEDIVNILLLLIDRGVNVTQTVNTEGKRNVGSSSVTMATGKCSFTWILSKQCNKRKRVALQVIKTKQLVVLS